MSHRHNHRVPISHNCMRWVRATDATLVLEPLRHYLILLDGDGGTKYCTMPGEELALYIRKYGLPVPYIAEILDPRSLDYAKRHI